VNDGGAQPIVEYEYDLGDRVLARGYRNGTAATYTYDAADRSLAIEHTLGPTRIAGFGYARDAEGNIAFEVHQHDAARSEALQYDALNRVIEYKVGSLVGSTVPVPSTQTAYALDALGNWNSKTTDAVTETRIHNQVNELVMVNTTALAYDANGNLHDDGALSYAYDEENRLVEVIRNADLQVLGQYQYDALGRRVVKVASAAAPFTTTVYLYDDARVIEEQDATTATRATYVYGNQVDEVLALARGGQAYYYHQNHLWSVAALTDANGSVVERYRYDAYGSPTVTDSGGAPVTKNAWGMPHSAIGNPRMFTGRDFDEETGLSFYRARYYDPVKGRFLQRDRAGYVDGMNLYEYVTSRPAHLVDPTGDLSAQSVGAGPQAGAYDGAFAAYWGVGLYPTADELKKLKDAGGGAIVSKRELSWDITCCDGDKKNYKGKRTEWFLDPVEFDRAGDLVANTDYSRPTGGAKRMGDDKVALAYISIINFYPKIDTKGKIVASVDFNLIAGQLVAVRAQFPQQHKGRGGGDIDALSFSWEEYVHKPWTDGEIKFAAFKPLAQGQIAIEMSWDCGATDIKVIGKPIPGGPQRIKGTRLERAYIREWTPNRDNTEWVKP
jgi:RHS repeat-associated protein